MLLLLRTDELVLEGATADVAAGATAAGAAKRLIGKHTSGNVVITMMTCELYATSTTSHADQIIDRSAVGRASR